MEEPELPGVEPHEFHLKRRIIVGTVLVVACGAAVSIVILGHFEPLRLVVGAFTMGHGVALAHACHEVRSTREIAKEVLEFVEAAVMGVFKV